MKTTSATPIPSTADDAKDSQITLIRSSFGKRACGSYSTSDHRFFIVGGSSGKNWERHADGVYRRRPGHAVRQREWRVGAHSKPDQPKSNQDLLLLQQSGLTKPDNPWAGVPFSTLRAAWKALQLVAYPEQVIA